MKTLPYLNFSSGFPDSFPLVRQLIGITLYPEDLLRNIDRLLMSHEEFYTRLVAIADFGKKNCDANLDRDLWLYLLGIKRLRETDLRKYDGKPIFKLYADKAHVLKKKQAKLIEETRNFMEEGEKLKKEMETSK